VEAPTREDLEGLRFGVPAELSDAAIDGGVRAVFEATLRRIEELGGELAEVTLPSAEHGISAYYVIAPAEASSNLARYDGVRYGMRAPGAGDLIEMYEETRAEGFGDEVKRRIMLGTYALSSGYYDAYYGQAQKVRRLISNDFAAAFEKVDVLVSPTAPTTAFRLGDKLDDPMSMYLQDVATIPANLAGVPGMSLPSGLADEDGLPTGIQILAPATKDERLYNVGSALEKMLVDTWGGALLAKAPELTSKGA